MSRVGLLGEFSHQVIAAVRDVNIRCFRVNGDARRLVELRSDGVALAVRRDLDDARSPEFCYVEEVIVAYRKADRP